MRRRFSIGAGVAAVLAVAAVAVANVSHAGWPVIDGKKYINKTDANAEFHGPLDKHNLLLGGHGDDTLYAGNVGDVLWGDYKPCCQPETQVDHLYGGLGHDFIYTSHGTNYVVTGGGPTGAIVQARFGRGTVTCRSPKDIVYLTHHTNKSYRFIGCKHVMHKK